MNGRDKYVEATARFLAMLERVELRGPIRFRRGSDARLRLCLPSTYWSVSDGRIRPHQGRTESM